MCLRAIFGEQTKTQTQHRKSYKQVTRALSVLFGVHVCQFSGRRTDCACHFRRRHFRRARQAHRRSSGTCRSSPPATVDRSIDCWTAPAVSDCWAHRAVPGVTSLRPPAMATNIDMSFTHTILRTSNATFTTNASCINKLFPVSLTAFCSTDQRKLVCCIDHFIYSI